MRDSEFSAKSMSFSEATSTYRLFKGINEATASLLSNDSFEVAIHRALAAIREATDVDRVYVFQNFQKPPSEEIFTSQKFEVVKPGINPQENNPDLIDASFSLTGFNRWYNLLSNRQTVKGLVDDFPRGEQGILKPQGIRSIIVVPVFVDNNFWGFIGFDDCTNDKVWIELEEELLINLANSIGNYIGRKDVEKALIKSTQSLEMAQKLGRIGNFEIFLERSKLTGSHQFFEIFNLDKKKEVRIQDLIDSIHPDEVENTFRITKEGMNHNRIITLNSRIIPFGTRQVVYLHCVIQVEYKDGKAVSLFGTIQDITERKKAELEIQELNKELENRVVERTEQLENSNRELESFAYSISHDLRAPLRHLNGYVELLEKRAATELSGDNLEFLSFIGEASRRMTRQIDDLLNYSRLGRKQILPVLVDVNRMVSTIVKVLTYANNSEIRWEIDPLPNVLADELLLEQAFSNIISNSIKYSGKEPKPVISIKGRIEDDKVVYSFSDNGVGFNMEYSDRLFGVFRRLHNEEDFEGSGIGLANVHRIVSRHRGKVWAESVVGEGATFYISLPYEIS